MGVVLESQREGIFRDGGGIGGVVGLERTRGGGAEGGVVDLGAVLPDPEDSFPASPEPCFFTPGDRFLGDGDLEEPEEEEEEEDDDDDRDFFFVSFLDDLLFSVEEDSRDFCFFSCFNGRESGMGIFSAFKLDVLGDSFLAFSFDGDSFLAFSFDDSLGASESESELLLDPLRDLDREDLLLLRVSRLLLLDAGGTTGRGR